MIMNRKQFLIQSSFATAALALPSFSFTQTPYWIYHLTGAPISTGENWSKICGLTFKSAFNEGVNLEHEVAFGEVYREGVLPFQQISYSAASLPNSGIFYDASFDVLHYSTKLYIDTLARVTQHIQQQQQQHPERPILIFTDIGRNAPDASSISHHTREQCRESWLLSNLNLPSDLKTHQIIPSFFAALRKV